MYVPLLKVQEFDMNALGAQCHSGIIILHYTSLNIEFSMKATVNSISILSKVFMGFQGHLRKEYVYGCDFIMYLKLL